ncbi:hypothetical protein DL93DRAFT_1307552 [Clavulina sp. PMI_390]|nr:hypothetical protein DL93DRAFT_1307552 [Clavulina sp. PMI_390]
MDKSDPNWYPQGGMPTSQPSSTWKDSAGYQSSTFSRRESSEAVPLGWHQPSAQAPAHPELHAQASSGFDVSQHPDSQGFVNPPSGQLSSPHWPATWDPNQYSTEHQAHVAHHSSAPLNPAAENHSGQSPYYPSDFSQAQTGQPQLVSQYGVPPNDQHFQPGPQHSYESHGFNHSLVPLQHVPGPLEALPEHNQALYNPYPHPQAFEAQSYGTVPGVNQDWPYPSSSQNPAVSGNPSTITQSQVDHRNSYYPAQPPVPAPGPYSRSQGAIRQPPKPPSLPVIDTSFRTRGAPSGGLPASSAHSPYNPAPYAPSPLSATSSHGFPSHAGPQFVNSPLSASAPETWQRHTIPNSGGDAGLYPASGIVPSSVPSSGTSLYPSGQSWAPPTTPGFPASPVDRHPQPGSKANFDLYNSSYPAAPDSRGSAPPRPHEITRTMSSSSVDPPPPVDDSLPKRGRRPMRKSASEQQLQHPQPPRRARKAQGPTGAIGETGPIRGVGREEAGQRRKSVTMKGDGSAPQPSLMHLATSHSKASEIAPSAMGTAPTSAGLTTGSQPGLISSSPPQWSYGSPNLAYQGASSSSTPTLLHSTVSPEVQQQLLQSTAPAAAPDASGEIANVFRENAERQVGRKEQESIRKSAAHGVERF